MSHDEQVIISIYEYNEDEEKRVKSKRKWSFCVVVIALVLLSTPFILSLYKRSIEKRPMTAIEKALMLNGLRISKQKNARSCATAFSLGDSKVSAKISHPTVKPVPKKPHPRSLVHRKIKQYIIGSPV